MARRTVDAAAAKISQIGAGALRRPLRAAPLPSDDWPSFEDGVFDDLEVVVVDEDRAITLM